MFNKQAETLLGRSAIDLHKRQFDSSSRHLGVNAPCLLFADAVPFGIALGAAWTARIELLPRHVDMPSIRGNAEHVAYLRVIPHAS